MYISSLVSVRQQTPQQVLSLYLFLSPSLPHSLTHSLTHPLSLSHSHPSSLSLSLSRARTLSLELTQPPQVPNYFLADDIRRTGIHDSILSAIKKYQHPLMDQVRRLHAVVATPSWGCQETLTRQAKRKARRVLGYVSSSRATYSAATALRERPMAPAGAGGAASHTECVTLGGQELPPYTSLDERLYRWSDS